ncbi:MAG: CHASE2 domain-containing protein [Spirochaetes bacterium]|jgi:adenylate cyclase|nr:CHASE2 domain-containing protein [Spirochaetota bacterium]
MAKRRSRFLETRYFGLVIGLFVVLLMVLVGSTTPMLDRLETKMLDAHFNLKQTFRGESTQEGVTQVRRNPDVSPDILLIGVDFRTLSAFGNWPFPRFRHADLLNSFARISDQSARERSILLDIFFVEPADSAYEDAMLREAIEYNGRTYLETILERSPAPPEVAREMAERHEVLYDTHGKVTNITGDWTRVPYNLGKQPPLKPLGRAAAGYGHANFYNDFDETYRRAPLVAKSTELIQTYRLDMLTPDVELDRTRFERLAWFDTEGREHTVAHPLTPEIIEELRSRMEVEAPQRVEDTDNDGEPDDFFYVVRKFQDHFIPAITLSLALDYFNSTYEELEVRLGEYIRIPEPQLYNPQTAEWGPYEIMQKPPEYDEEGSLVAEAEYRRIDEITIPIDETGSMLINFMGPRSSPARDGYQTFPVRPYAGYASRVPGIDPETWPPTRAVENKILMVGAFAPGMAADEKTTPYGLMYGVEIHANALNTILMDNFLQYAPAWFDALVLLVLALVTAFMASRLSTIWSLFASLFLIVVLFFVTTIVFDDLAYIVNFSTPAIGVLLTFLAVVVYRVMTEEKDKRRIRDMFGKYVSPRVVDQILENPPELGGVDKELSVLFSDIRGFTTLSESMTPQELVNHLNLYLTAMTDVILESEGTLDKYVGDEIMCFWGAPVSQSDHALRACRSAVRQIEVLEELNASWPAEKRIAIGIGINSGIMTVGNMGSQGRMNYTLMGDNVNLGARLEGTNKMYGTAIIMSEYTYGLVKDHVVARELDNIRVKGKNRPVQIYELIDVIETA